MQQNAKLEKKDGIARIWFAKLVKSRFLASLGMTLVGASASVGTRVR
jgi:hypothetical protein